MRAFLLAAAVALAACAAPSQRSIYQEPDRLTPRKIAPRPDYPGYGAMIARQPIPWSNASLVRDLVMLTFFTEWGGGRPRLLRWDGPARVAIAAPELDRYRDDVADLIDLIRERAPAAPVELAAGRTGEISLITAPRAEMKNVAPTALCFFVPGEGAWADLLAADARGKLNWRDVKRLEAITIVIPEFAAPHEIRSCILEEIMQALGPSNDLGALGDSMFNDDNAHTWPTSFDLAMLAMLYDPALKPGMTLKATRKAALGAAERLGHGGDARRRYSVDDRKFDKRMIAATTADDADDRAGAARDAVAMAEADAGMRADHRLGEARRALGNALFTQKRYAAAREEMERAEALLAAAVDEDSPHLARARLDLGLTLVATDEPEKALAAFDAAAPVFAGLRDDWRLAQTLRWRAVAARNAGDVESAALSAADAAAWARYVFGADSRAVESWNREFGEMIFLRPSN